MAFKLFVEGKDLVRFIDRDSRSRQRFGRIYRPGQDATCSNLSLSPSKNKLAGKSGFRKRNSKRVAERVLVGMRKRQKNIGVSDCDSVASGSFSRGDSVRSTVHKDNEGAISSSQKKEKSPVSLRSRRNKSSVKDSLDGPSNEVNLPECSNDPNTRKEVCVDENICKEESSNEKSWRTIEKGLFEKGLEIFGNNSCLIARNLLTGMKTCSEVFQYMKFFDNKLSCRGGDGGNSLTEGHSKGDLNESMMYQNLQESVQRLSLHQRSMSK